MKISTPVARPGTPVREVFKACSSACTPAIPFCDGSGQISGQVSLRNILIKSCLPEFMVELAMLLGEQLSHMQDMVTETRQLLDSPVDAYVQKPQMSLGPEAPAIKALALMEQNDMNYLFVVDNGRYLGVVTLQSLAGALVNIDGQP